MPTGNTLTCHQIHYLSHFWAVQFLDLIEIRFQKAFEIVDNLLGRIN